jgi:hypothetical protein
MRRFLGLLAMMLLMGTLALPAGAAVFYINDFESTPANWLEWSLPIQATTPIGARKFLGIFDNDTATLTLSGLPAHTNATVSFDLFILESWDGNNTGYGPDYWKVSYDGTTLLNTTFQIESFGQQSYPGNYFSSNLPRQGAAENNSLGYTGWGDSVYQLSFTFPHSGSSLVLDFQGYNLQGWPDEGWGLDNFRVDITPVPLPPAMLLLGSGLLGLVGWRRLRKE